MKVRAVIPRASNWCLATWTFLLFLSGSELALGQGQPFLDPGDTILAIDETGLLPLSNFPGGESPPKLIDNDNGTKYLNFGEEGSGFIVTPALMQIVESFQMVTANDAPERDPSSWELYGFTGTLISTDDSLGDAEPWTLIGSGAVALPDTRGTLGPIVDVPTAIAYEHYKMVFPTVKDPVAANSMQLAEIEFYTDDAATAGNEILAPNDAIIGIHIGGPDSRYPGGESPSKALDDTPSTKYLNFGKEKSGLIVTNVQGASPLYAMRLTTANDAEERDPASYQLYGTNDAIQSMNNSEGNGGENWVLISEGTLSLPAGRENASTLVTVGSTDAYNSYKLVFPTVKDAAAANSMQIADVQFYAVPEPSTLLLTLLVASAGMVGLRRR